MLLKQWQRVVVVGLLFTFAESLMAGNNIVTFGGISEIAPSVFLLIRTVLAIPALLPLVLLERQFLNDKALQEPPVGTWRLHLQFFILATFGVSASQILYIEGLRYTTPVIGAIFDTVVPACTLVVLLCIGQEKFSFVSVFILAVSIVGCLLVAIYGKAEAAASSFGLLHPSSYYALGIIYLVFNSIFFSLYYIMQKHILEYVRPVALTMWTFIYGIPLVSAHVLCSCLLHDWDAIKGLAKVSPLAWLSIIYAAFFGTSVAYVGITLGIWLSNAMVASVFLLALPVLTVGLSAIFLHMVPNIMQILGSLLVATGLVVALLTYNEAKAVAHTATEDQPASVGANGAPV